MKSTTNSSPPRDWTQSRGFTILEVLIAITLSLVLMLSLTRAFKFLADQIRDNRVRVELSNRAQNVNQILQDDLRNMTVKLAPRDANSEDEGYFVYYEGPGTDVTSVMLGTQVATDEPSPYFQDSRFGDFDDYLAFTVYNPETPFRGVVPKYLLLEKQFETDPDMPIYTRDSGLEPVVIYSHYAEIIYWVQPEHVTQTSTNGLEEPGLSYSYDQIGNPSIRDETGDGYPDRLTLHRRVLLIRPDLNSSMTPSARGPASIFPGTLPQLATNTPQGNYFFMQPDPWPSDATANPLPRIIRTGGEGNDQRDRSWQIGMAPIHQQCDLSVRWVLDPTTGAPTSRVAANSLADLTQPHNRFAHVRVPAATLGFNNPSFTSMPILAVGSQMPHISKGLSAGLTVPTFYRSLAGQGQSAFNGFLRPEFALGFDFTHTEVPTPHWGRERLGEDILTASVLGFDVQIYDQLALVANHPGPDGAWGESGVPGDPNTDDLVISPNDPLFFEITRTPLLPIQLASRGAYVDLAYDRLAGGTVRDSGPLSAIQNSNAGPVVEANLKLYSQFSLYREPLQNTRVEDTLPLSLLKSGKAIGRRDGNNPQVPYLLFQPTYDTFTYGYETDGYLQREITVQEPGFVGTVWFNSPLQNGLPSADPSATGLGFDVNGSPVQRETAAPFAAPASAIRVRLRIIDENSGTTTQQAVTSNSDF